MCVEVVVVVVGKEGDENVESIHGKERTLNYITVPMGFVQYRERPSPASVLKPQKEPQPPP